MCPHTLSGERAARSILQCLRVGRPPPASRAWLSRSSRSRRPRTAIFFPGQGVQRVGMTTPWLDAFPRTVRPVLDEIDDAMRFPLSKIISDGPNASLTATENSQPAIMATSVLILRVLENEFGFRTDERVDFTLGHSLGEFAALVAGGYLSFQDAMKMIRKRGEAMAEASRKATDQYGGEVGMVALVTEDEVHLQILVDAINDFIQLSTPGSKTDSVEDVPSVQQVFIANHNSKNQIVLSGSIEGINTLLTHLRQFGGHDPRNVRLNSDSPFHTPLMKPAQDLMKRVLASPSSITGEDVVNFPGRIPCVSNISARPFRSRADLKDLLARQCTETVRWWESVRYLDQEEKVRRWIGIGPGKVGRNLVGKEVGMTGKVKGGGVWGITSPHEAEEVMKALDETESSADDALSAINTLRTPQPTHHPSRPPKSKAPVYIYNPAIVQRLWPPPPENVSKIPLQLTHNDAMFKPTSTTRSSH